MALATVADLEARSGQTLTGDDIARAAAYLDDASAAVEKGAGTTFSRTTQTVEKWPTDWRFEVFGKDVTDVSAVDADNNDVTITKIARNLWTTRHSGPLYVTFTAGWVTAPQDIVAVVCSMAQRAMSTDPEKQNVTQSQQLAGSFQILESFGAASGAGAVGMLPGEKAVVSGYRRKPRGIYAGSWA